MSGKRLHPNTYRTFRSMLEDYRPPHPVRMICSPNLFLEQQAWGLTTPLFGKRHGTRFRIELLPQTTDQEIEVLAHEYAHVLAWPHSGGLHSPLWGVYYATLYSEYVDG